MKQDVISTKLVLTAIICFAVLVVLTILSIVMYPKYAFEKHDVIPSDPLTNTQIYSDTINRGQSIISPFMTDKERGFNCKINKGHPYPYCLTQLNFTKSHELGKDLSQFYKMRIFGTYEPPQETDFLRVVLMNYDPVYSNLGNVHTYKYNLLEIQSKDLSFPIEINLDDLSVPLWWASNMRKKSVDTRVDLTNIPTIELSTGTEASLGDHKLRVSKIEFERMIITKNELYEYIMILWGLVMFSFIISSFIYLLMILKKSKTSEQNLIAINDVLSEKSAELEIISKQDELTGLYNRSGLKSKMIECLEKKSFPLTVVMIDVDHFKRINDSFGHQKGDIVLAKFGKILNEFVQGEESASRFGGEEFILLMPNKGINDVINRLDVLRKLIENTSMGVYKSVTASFGVASSAQYAEFKTLIESADNALYQAKKDGRNCIRVSNSQTTRESHKKELYDIA